jgi:hypothetical protein
MTKQKRADSVLLKHANYLNMRKRRPAVRLLKTVTPQANTCALCNLKTQYSPRHLHHRYGIVLTLHSKMCFGNFVHALLKVGVSAVA